jgi:protein-S-isoprenylcysteine O-methyltransferase Ste14
VTTEPAAPGPRAQTDDPPLAPLGVAWVLGQVLAGVAVLVVGAWAPRPRRARGLRRTAGLLVGVFGIVAVMTARRSLGSAFSVFPRPVPGAPVADDGVYRVVRHPMYTGVLAQATAVSIAGSPWALVPTAALAVILDRKAADEERRLTLAHPAFAGYADRTRWRFLPGLR